MDEKLLEKMEKNTHFLRFIWTSDKAHFHLERNVNSNTNVFWRSERPIDVAERPLNPLNVLFGQLFRREKSLVLSSPKKMGLRLQ